MRMMIFQHLGCEHPGIWRDFLREDGVDVVTVALDEGHRIPSLDGVDALLVFGGPMNVDEHHRFPWLAPETAAIREAALGHLPVFGVCLGAQLLARALGARVTRNPVPEIGLLEVELTEAGAADPLFQGWPQRVPVVQWHSDTFALPERATLLASSPVCRHQAFRYGPCAYGVQFHPEVTADMVVEWAEIPEYAESMRQMTATSGGGPFARVPEEAPSLNQRSRQLYRNFTALLGRSA